MAYTSVYLPCEPNLRKSASLTIGHTAKRVSDYHTHKLGPALSDTIMLMYSYIYMQLGGEGSVYRMTATSGAPLECRGTIAVNMLPT